ncbi:MAG: hypothetical protein O2958_11625 [Gemmatimonadetes bacterium]|nr:hypothetical protein [Gemmatimonadota bacterium]MDA1104514.1 hypothetical protein [Gemmatimonadota bacterium]
MSLNTYRRLAVLALVPFLPGGTSMSPMHLDAAETVWAGVPVPLPVTTSDEDRAVLPDPRVENDSLANEAPAPPAGAEMNSVGVPRVDRRWTFTLILFSAVTLLALGIGHATASDPWGD